MSEFALLERDDPFVPSLRRRASRSEYACKWYMAVVADWARVEFFRRAGSEDIEEEATGRALRELSGKQVAVLTTHLQLNATDTPRRRNRWSYHIGKLLGSSHINYLKMDQGYAALSGEFYVMDVFELPDDWKLDPWPSELWPDADEPEHRSSPTGRALSSLPRVSRPRPRAGFVSRVAERVAEGGNEGSVRALAIAQMLGQISQMVHVHHDMADDVFVIADGYLEVFGKDLRECDTETFDKMRREVWEHVHAAATIEADKGREGLQAARAGRQSAHRISGVSSNG